MKKNFSLIAAVEKWVIQKWGDVRYMPKNVVPELEYFWNQINANYSFWWNKIEVRGISKIEIYSFREIVFPLFYFIGGRFPAPYVDRFGEHDLDLIRGKIYK